MTVFKIVANKIWGFIKAVGEFRSLRDRLHNAAMRKHKLGR